MSSRGLLTALLGLLAVSAEVVASEKVGAQLEGGIGRNPSSAVTKRGFDVGGYVDYRLLMDGVASLWVEAGGDYRYRPPDKAAFTDSTTAYAGGGGLQSVSASVRLKARLLSNRTLSAYATAGLRVANDTSAEVFYTGGRRIIANFGERSVTNALFEVGVGLRFRIANQHGFVTELLVDDGTSVFPGPVWSVRLGYRVGP